MQDAGICAWKRNKIHTARWYFESANTATSGGLALAQFNLAQIYRQLGRTEDSFRVLWTLHHTDPLNMDVLEQLIVTSARRGPSEDFVQMLRVHALRRPAFSFELGLLCKLSIIPENLLASVVSENVPSLRTPCPRAIAATADCATRLFWDAACRGLTRAQDALGDMWYLQFWSRQMHRVFPPRATAAILYAFMVLFVRRQFRRPLPAEICLHVLEFFRFEDWPNLPSLASSFEQKFEPS
jgi:hypothetical protein